MIFSFFRQDVDVDALHLLPFFLLKLSRESCSNTCTDSNVTMRKMVYPSKQYNFVFIMSTLLPCFVRSFSGLTLNRRSVFQVNYGPAISATSLFSSSSEHHDNGTSSKKKKKKKVEYNFDADSLAKAFESSMGSSDIDVSDREMTELLRMDEIEMARFDEENLSSDHDGYSLEFADDDEDFLDFGESGEKDESDHTVNISMRERMAAARDDLVSGSVTIPDELDSFVHQATEEDLRAIGFRREENPFGRDETPRNPLNTIRLDMKPLECPACGANFQSKDVSKPGFLPPDKLQEQIKLSQEISKKNKADELRRKQDEWSVDDEIEWLLENTDGPSDENVDEVDEEEMIEPIAFESPKKKTICQRCHNLQNFGNIDNVLRPGWSDEPLLSQEGFRELLAPIREKNAVIVALVDLFDFSGSILPELDSIAGDNPVIIAANKADLLPSEMGQLRVENWVRRELEYMGIRSLANIGGAVRLISCKTGFGISQMFGKIRNLAEERECDVYIVGAANAGKSTLLNRILRGAEEKNQETKRRKKRAGNANAIKGAVTTSPIPGTTLKFIKVDLGDGMNMYDTPGLLVPGTLTSRLTSAELKMVVPKK